MNLLNFVSQYPDESVCRIKFKEIRDKQGVLYPCCGNDSHYWKKDKKNNECKQCGKRQSLRANTVMQGSQLPFCYWFIAIHLLTGTKKNVQERRKVRHKARPPFGTSPTQSGSASTGFRSIVIASGTRGTLLRSITNATS